MTDPHTHGETIDQGLLERFESAWLAGHPEPIERFLPGEEDADYLTTLEMLVEVELRLAWESWSKTAQGGSESPQDETVARPAQLETYLQRFPRLNQPEIIRRLLQQECSVRKRCGEDASIEEYRRRFPEVELEVAEDRVESELPMVSQSSRDVRMAETLATGQPGGASVPGIEQQEFGNYEALEEIGRGGMGVVYRARQRTADRTVALKVIRRDRLEQLPCDTNTSALERFRHEAQAAARLDHENIVTVYEVGEVDNQPFFSMRYVEGRSLAQILRDGPMDNRRAAAYLEPVARAVHEAHCQGILHRDLKPQNILVDDKTDRALVADFGLAKLTEGGDELTRAGEIMGTPSYMSPEQAKDSGRVAAETDIYALGATLYHVLTARPPFQAATPLETLRQVIDEEPAPPRQLNPSIDRDLETICLKCLQKEPLRRYHSAHALADDLRRYLAGEPIQARPIGPMGRIWRWCRRKPALATAIGLAATFLVVGSVVSTVLLFETLDALNESEISRGVALTAQKEAEDSRDQAEAARQRAENSFKAAQGAVNDFLTEVAEETLLDRPAMQPLQRRLLKKARDYYQGFLEERGDDPTIRDAVALAHFREGLATEKIDSPEKAMNCYLRAQALQEDLHSEHSNDPDCLRNLSNTWTAIGRILTGQLNLIEARDVFQKAVEFREKLYDQPGSAEAENARKLANSHMNLGVVLMELGATRKSDDPERQQLFEQASTELKDAQELRNRILRTADSPSTRRDLAKGHFLLAKLAFLRANAEDAETNLLDSIKGFEYLLSKDAQDLDNQNRLATCYRLLGDLKSALRRPEDARGWYQKALTRMRDLHLGNPAVTPYRVALGNLYMSLGQLERDEQNSEAARTAFGQAREIFAKLVADFEGNAEYQGQLDEAQAQIKALSPARPQDDVQPQDE